MKSEREQRPVGNTATVEENGAEGLPHPRAEDLDLSRIMQALSDPGRLRLVAVLADGGEHPCHGEEYDVAVHKSTLSHHFRVLREAGVTGTRVAGRNRFVRLRREAVDVRFPGLLDAVIGGLGADAVEPPRSTASKSGSS